MKNDERHMQFGELLEEVLYVDD